MEKNIVNSPNDQVAIICKIFDQGNNTIIVLPEEVSLGKVVDNNFYREDKLEAIPYLLDLNNIKKGNELYYMEAKSISSLEEEFNIKDNVDVLMYLYFKDVATNFNILLYDEYRIKLYNTSYKNINKEIGGTTIKRFDEEVKEEVKETPAIVKSEPKKAFSVIEMEKYLKSRILENDDVIESMVTVISKNMRAKKKSRVHHMLSIGPTGTGKTATYEAIAEYLNIPCTIYDCNELTSAGYEGKNIEDVVKKIYYNSDGDIKKAERSIVVFDEFDKLASNGAEVKDIYVQNALLKFFDGYVYDISLDKKSSRVSIDTSFMSIGACGAFQEIFEEKKKKNSLGFASHTDTTSKLTVTNEDLIKYGMLDQAIARLHNKYLYKDLDKDALKRIITTSVNSPLLDQIEMYKEDYNVILEYTDSFLDELVSVAYKRGLGCRGLYEIVQEVFTKIDHFLEVEEDLHPDHPQRKILITDEIVHDNSKFKL